MDKTAIIWDGRTGEVKQQFEFHTGGHIPSKARLLPWQGPSRGISIAGNGWNPAASQGASAPDKLLHVMNSLCQMCSCPLLELLQGMR